MRYIAARHTFGPCSIVTLSCSIVTLSCSIVTISCSIVTLSCSIVTLSCSIVTVSCSIVTLSCSIVTVSCSIVTLSCFTDITVLLSKPQWKRTNVSTINKGDWVGLNEKTSQILKNVFCLNVLYWILIAVATIQSHYRPEVPRGFQEVKIPRLRDNGSGWW